jgi:O-antigen ligase
LVQEHPFGYGLINHSFGALALQKWSDFYKPIGKYRHASHSGWLDFTLGFGIPGLAFVLLPMWVAFYRAGGQTGFWFEWVRWSVPVVTLVYAITEVCTAHFIEFLFFYIAMASGITTRKTNP